MNFDESKIALFAPLSKRLFFLALTPSHALFFCKKIRHLVSIYYKTKKPHHRINLTTISPENDKNQ
jgi:hypothetical protein